MTNLRVYVACGSARAQLDEDLPAHGAHYCTPCARYFVTDAALALHTRTKPHKRRCAAGSTADSQCRSHTPGCKNALLASRKRHCFMRKSFLTVQK